MKYDFIINTNKVYIEEIEFLLAVKNILNGV